VGIAVLVEVGKVASGFLPPEVVVTTQQVISGAGEWGKIALEAGALTVVSGIASWDINQERIRQVAERMRLQKKAGDQKPDESGVTRTAEQQDQLIRRIRLGMDPLEAGGWFTTMKLGERMDKKTQAYIEARSGASQEEVKDVIEQIGVGIDQVVRKSALSGGKDVADLAKGLTTEERALAVQACEVVVTGTDAALKSDVEKARLALEAGLKEVHQKVVDARKAVGDAIRALAVVLGEPVPEAVKE
jgi:hypothetical protein